MLLSLSRGDVRQTDENFPMGRFRKACKDVDERVTEDLEGGFGPETAGSSEKAERENGEKGVWKRRHSWATNPTFDIHR